MKKLLIFAALGLALLTLAPDAEAYWNNGRGYRAGGGGVVVRPGPRVFFGFGGYPYWGGYPYPYAYPYGYYPPVVYTAPPAGYAAPPPPAPAPAPADAPAPDFQREVVYPHGKYVLEGDGVNTEYRWTWIASPTAPPPPPPVEPRQ